LVVIVSSRWRFACLQNYAAANRKIDHELNRVARRFRRGSGLRLRQGAAPWLLFGVTDRVIMSGQPNRP
jgi:hypothetical protein